MIQYKVISKIRNICDVYYILCITYKLYKVTSFYYPNFLIWMIKVINEVNKGYRTFIVAKNNKDIVGVLIAKHTLEENKICTLWVDLEYRKQGIATKLLTKSYYFFNKNPIISISDIVLNDFKGIIKKYCTFIEKRIDEYKKDHYEYYYLFDLEKI